MEENNLNPTPTTQNQPVNNRNTQMPKLEEIKQLIQSIFQRVKTHPFIANMNPQMKRMIKFLLIGLIGFFVLLMIIGFIFSSLKNRPKTIKPTPTPRATSIEISLDEEIRNPSPYATDSAVLKIEEDVRNLDSNLSNTNLKDSAIWPPDIKFDVKFEE